MSQIHVVKVRAEDGPLSPDEFEVLDLPTRLEHMTEALTAPQIAKLLGMGRSKVYEMASEGRIPHFRISGSIRFDPVQVARWLRERQIGTVRLAA